MEKMIIFVVLDAKKYQALKSLNAKALNLVGHRVNTVSEKYSIFKIKFFIIL
jgi:hypothetical protein